MPPLESWRVDAGAESVAFLRIPDLVERRRILDVDVTLLVNVPEGADGAWHELTVEFDGLAQWSRRVDSQNRGSTDGLDYHQRVQLEPEQDLRVRALVKSSGVSVRQLLIEAVEETG